jgi:hypothetical protein
MRGEQFLAQGGFRPYNRLFARNDRAGAKPFEGWRRGPPNLFPANPLKTPDSAKEKFGNIWRKQKKIWRKLGE